LVGTLRSEGNLIGRLYIPVNPDVVVKDEQEKDLDITKNGSYEVLPDNDMVLSRVGVNVNVPIPDGYVKPVGTLDIEKNGTFNVTEKEEVIVSVPERKEEQTKTVKITKNGTHEVKPDENKVLSSVSLEVDVKDNEYEWQEDTSGVVYETTCYQNSRISAQFTENGTLTYKRNKLENANQCPKWSYSTMQNLANGQRENSKFFINVRQAEVINIPEATGDMLITELGESAFAKMFNLRVIKLPETIVTLGKSVFDECINLKTVDLPDTVITMGANVFRYCYCLEEFSIPPLVTSLNSGTFVNCYSLKKVNGIERMTSIGSSCFDFCGGLSGTVIFNEALATLSANDFRCCVSIEKIVFNGITVCNANTFTYCYGIKEVEIPKGWNVSIYFNSTNILTQECLHKMIENLADMTGQTAPDFKVGPNNIKKIDDEHIAMLESKNYNYS
jgi:hypothetical protein